MVDQFCLKWNNYQASLTNAFKSLLENEDFVDMTLSAGGKTLRAHKVVLSACSSYFKQLLKGISHWQHPVLVLRDVPFIDLYTILEFIYMGEVNIAQGDLQSFLRTAELLQIKGLAENVSWNPEADNENEDSQAPSSPEPMNSELGQSPDSLCVSPTPSQYSNTSQTPRKPNVKRRRLSSGAETPKLLNDSVTSITNQNTNANKMEEDIEFKEEINDLEEESNLYVDESASTEGELLLATDNKTFTNIQKNSSVDANDNTESNMGPNHKKCVQCGIIMLKKNFARHMRDMHTMPKPRSLCPLCQKSYKTPDWLKDHIRRGHGYTKELTDQLMSSLKSSPTKNSESHHDVSMQKLSLQDTKVPPLVPIGDMNMKEGKPSPSLALIDIQSQPMTILTSQNIVKKEENIPTA